jgi:hypothetical protein
VIVHRDKLIINIADGRGRVSCASVGGGGERDFVQDFFSLNGRGEDKSPATYSPGGKTNG